jgi:multiple sugar transport system substrate-binding protein
VLLAGLGSVAAVGLAACGGSGAGTGTSSASLGATTATSAAPASTTGTATTAPTTASSAARASTAATTSATAPAATSLAASSAAPGKAPVAMEFEHFFTGTLWDNGFKPIVDLFEERNPSIKWDGLAVGYNDMLPKLITLTAGGTPPDGTSTPNEWAIIAALQGLLQPIDDRIAKAGSPTSGWIADIFPARMSNYAVNGKHYGLPIDMGTSAIYYDKDVFDEAGVAYPKPGWTWNDLWGIASKLTLKKGDQKIYGFQYANDLYWLYALYGSLGGSYFDKALTKATFDTAASEQALQTLLDARVKSNVTPYGAEATAISKQANGKQQFTLGLYGMDHAWIGLIAYLHDKGVAVKNWDVAPIPTGGPDQVQIVGGQGFAIVSGAKHPDEAWAWNTFMVSDDVQKMLGVNGVWDPGRKSMAKYGLPKDGQPSRFIEAFYDPVATAGFSPWWYVPGWDQWSKVINDGLKPAWDGQATASDVAAKITPTLNAMLQNRPKA